MLSGNGNGKAVPLVITTCTNRKRRPVSANLRMSDLPVASLADLVSEWAARVGAETIRFPADEIYGGRSFQEAVAASRTLGCQLMVVSAGLGMIHASERVPPYACTILEGSVDSVAKRTVGGASSNDWWAALSRESPFSVRLHDAALAGGGLIFAALSDAYIEMISEELLALPEAIMSRLRLFTRAPMQRLAPDLRSFVMPYDDRLDGRDSPIPGTRGDFAARALNHFVTAIVAVDDDRTAGAHAAAVETVMKDWRFPAVVKRDRYDDEKIIELIRSHWNDEGGCTLERIRHEFNVACEQGRFSALSGIVRAQFS